MYVNEEGNEEKYENIKYKNKRYHLREGVF